MQDVTHTVTLFQDYEKAIIEIMCESPNVRFTARDIWEISNNKIGKGVMKSVIINALQGLSEKGYIINESKNDLKLYYIH